MGFEFGLERTQRNKIATHTFPGTEDLADDATRCANPAQERRRTWETRSSCCVCLSSFTKKSPQENFSEKSGGEPKLHPVSVRRQSLVSDQVEQSGRFCRGSTVIKTCSGKFRPPPQLLMIMSDADDIAPSKPLASCSQKISPIEFYERVFGQSRRTETPTLHPPLNHILIQPISTGGS